MTTTEILGALKEKVQAELDTKALELQALTDLEAAIKSEVSAQYDLGFNDGLKQVSVPGDKVFSNEELDAEIALAKAPLLEQIAALMAEVADLKLSVDKASAETDGKIASALASFKVELAAKYAEVQASEAVVESNFSDLLK